MMSYDIEQAARLWQQILLTDTDRLLGEQYASRLSNRDRYDRLAQPGYVGAKYSGLLFISMNPGNGSSPPSEGDLKQYPALERLRDANPGDVVAAFRQLNARLAEITPTWGIYQKLVDPILSAIDISIHQISYLTLLQWRTAKSSGLSPLYRKGQRRSVPPGEVGRS